MSNTPQVKTAGTCHPDDAQTDLGEQMGVPVKDSAAGLV